VVNTGLVGRSGYALRIAETAPGQWWESEPIWGILYTPTFPCKPGDICTTRFIVAVERPDASWDGRLTVYSSGIGGIFEGNSTLDHDNWQDTAPRITFINETATKLWIANYVGYGGPSSISNEVVIETAGVASGRGEMDIYPETSMLTGVTPLPVIFRILSATVTVKSPPSTGLTPVSTASAPTEHRRPVPPPWHSRSEVEP
jgi:hypothetical protein